eukprot:TRINITY_DN5715_c0_g1_i10.p1 TRINITY_DN5715_c0_g1~~TRINITY_DN5715_c0_g1_i10.p1  ORF type:complete len:437 (-),score=141.74 TRINITY_DN5715_c0_g1_i10:154-1464(-)
MRFKKVRENGRVVWRRQPKQLPNGEQVREIEGMSVAKAKKLPTEDKVIWLNAQINARKKEVQRTSCFFSSAPIIIVVERSHFLRDSFEQFRTITDLDLRRELKIHFIDEVCQDAGGLIREWFSVLTEELFATSFGLFVRTNTSIVSYTINPDSKQFHSNHLEYYSFCGQIIAKALFEKIPIKAYLAKYILKQITCEEVAAEDLKYYDEELWKSVEFIKSNPVQTYIGTFTTTRKDSFKNTSTTIALKERGDKESITEENKAEFVRLLCEYHLVESIKEQFEALHMGICSLIPKEAIRVLDSEELEFFLCGDHEISLIDWKENTRYKGVYHKSHPVIKWFWNILSKLSTSELEKFFQFCTGSVRVPIEGFKGLTSNNGKLCGFSIESKDYQNEELDFLVAHTCFNRIELPIYPCIEIMEKAIRKIISTPLCFQFAFE